MAQNTNHHELKSIPLLTCTWNWPGAQFRAVVSVAGRLCRLLAAFGKICKHGGKLPFEDRLRCRLQGMCRQNEQRILWPIAAQQHPS